MADHAASADSPPLRSGASQHSLRSVTAKPSGGSVFGSGLHLRSASDGVSISSQSKVESNLGVSRHASFVSLESRAEQPITGAAEFSSPQMPGPAAWSEGGDLGSRTTANMVSPDLSSEEMIRTQQKPGSTPLISNHLLSPTTPVASSRPRPTPFQFEDITSYTSPPPSTGSTFSPFARFGHRRTDSRTNLLNTPTPSIGTSASWRSPHMPPPYYEVPQQYTKRKRWWLWRPAWIMYVFFICGFAFAVGHHLFYRSRDGQPADDQLAMLRYGTALAFATKACLVSAVIVAYRQRIWMTVQSKMLSVAALDSLFAATEDLSALWNLEIYKRAKVAITLAILVW